MKFNYIWEEKQDLKEIDIISHPLNQPFVKQLEKTLTKNFTFSAENPKNNRTQLISSTEVEAIEAMGHLSKLILIDGNEFWLPKKLKELQFLETFNFFRINNSTILNLTQATAFISGAHARIEVTTKNNLVYIVSRHYAKIIKERLT